jgi:ABC-2 type transport system permease protein
MHHLALIFALAAKDWRLFLADRRAAVLCVAVPILLASGFGLVFDRSPAASGAPKLPLLLVVDGAGPFAEAVAADLLAGPRVEAEVVSPAEAERRVADRRPGVAVVFPPGFDAVGRWLPGSVGDKPAVRVLHNPLTASEGQWAEGVVTEAVMKRLARGPLAALAGEVSLPFAVRTEPLAAGGHGRFNAYTHSFCGMTLQYLLFWGMESGLLLLRERNRSLWGRLMAAPVPLWAVLAGKAVSTAAIAFGIVLVTFGFGRLAFGVSVGGSWVGFLLLAVAASTLAAATGLLVAAVGGTEARARSVAILVILAVSMLGGLWLPAFVLPGWARDVALSLPTTWAMRGLDGVTWQGRGLLTALPSVGVVAAFAAVFLAVATARLVSSEARRRRGTA